MRAGLRQGTIFAFLIVGLTAQIIYLRKQGRLRKGAVAMR
jgi:hypothetical protein